VIRNDFQDVDSQDVYAVTLTSKVFRMLMTLVTAFHLKTRQLDWSMRSWMLIMTNSYIFKCLMTTDCRARFFGSSGHYMISENHFCYDSEFWSWSAWNWS
jgi:hypothetical protein